MNGPRYSGVPRAMGKTKCLSFCRPDNFRLFLALRTRPEPLITVDSGTLHAQLPLMHKMKAVIALSAILLELTFSPLAAAFRPLNELASGAPVNASTAL